MIEIITKTLESESLPTLQKFINKASAVGYYVTERTFRNGLFGVVMEQKTKHLVFSGIFLGRRSYRHERNYYCIIEEELYECTRDYEPICLASLKYNYLFNK